MNNKAFAVIAISFLCFSTFSMLMPPIKANGNTWTLKQMTKNDVEDTLGNWNAISGDGSRIVFDRRPSQWGPEGYGVDWDVYAMNTWDNPGEERQMTTAWGEDVGAGISSDGNMIAFASGRYHIGEPWDLEIFAMNFTDSPGKEVQVSDNTAYLDSGVSISDDGKTIAWNTGPNTPLKHAEYITIAEISDTGQIAYTVIDTPEWDCDPTLSLDGEKVCFRQFTDQVNLGVFIANTDGTGLTRIPGAYGQGVISGDGTKVAVIYNDGDWEFSVVDVATGNTLFKTDNSVYDEFGSFDGSGNIIAYSREGEICICDLQTKQETRLTYDSFEDYAPRLNGDGDTLAFVSMGRDGPDAEIFILNRRVPSKFAVIIGVDEYKDPINNRKGGPGNSAQDMYDFLTSSMGFPYDHIHLFVDKTGRSDDDVTKAMVENELNWLQAITIPEDKVVFYYAGHGWQNPTAGNEYIQTHDDLIRDDEFAAEIDKIESENLVVILDISFSGGFVTDGQKLWQGILGIAPSWTDLAEETPSGRIILTACAENVGPWKLRDAKEWPWRSTQLRYETIFTYYLLKGFRGSADENSDGKVTVEEAFTYARRLSLWSQTPMIYDGFPSYGSTGELFLGD
jgi:Tol biopolymer transport system component